MTGADQWAGAVAERDAHACQWCGRRAAECHHRKFRSQGGAHTPDNRVMLCGRGNTSGDHGKAHGQGESRERAEHLGYTVPSWADPAEVPMWSEPLGSWLALHEDGTVTMLGPVRPEVTVEQ